LLAFEGVPHFLSYPLRSLSCVRPKQQDNVGLVDVLVQTAFPSLSWLKIEHILEGPNAHRRQNLRPFQYRCPVLGRVRDEGHPVTPGGSSYGRDRPGWALRTCCHCQGELNMPDRNPTLRHCERTDNVAGTAPFRDRYAELHR